MLILSRKFGETIKIGNDVEIIVSRISGNRVEIGIDAPQHVHIRRGELDAIDRGGRDRDASKSPT